MGLEDTRYYFWHNIREFLLSSHFDGQVGIDLYILKYQNQLVSDKKKVAWDLPGISFRKKKFRTLGCPNAQHVKPHFESAPQTDNEVLTQYRTVIEMDWVRKNFSECELRYVYKTRQQSLIKFILWPHSQSVFPAWLEIGIFFFLQGKNTSNNTSEWLMKVSDGSWVLKWKSFGKL